MTKPILTRIVSAIVTLLVMTFLIYFLASLVPGGAAYTILGDQATPERVAQLNAALGLDKPLLEQYWHWLTNALSGNLGQSLYSGQPVTKIVAERFWPTFWISILATFWAAVIGIALGMFTALRKGFLSRFLDGLSLFFTSLPYFWVGILLIIVFAGELRILPSIGYVSPQVSFSQWAAHLVLPVLVFVLAGVATVARQTRDAYSEALSRDFIRFMQANGISSFSVLFRHALRSASVRIVAAVALTFIATFTATAAVELVFAVPGLGQALVQASLNHDLAVVQGGVLVVTLVIVIVSVITDIAYALLNPKVESK